MNDNEIKETLDNLGYGEKPPEALLGIIREFRKRKSAIYPQAIEISDVVTATIIYDFVMAVKEKKARG